MSVNIKELNLAIIQKWKNYQHIAFDPITLKFVKDFLAIYYEQVRKGLLDYVTPSQEKKILLSEVLKPLKSIEESELYIHIKNWMDKIDDESIMVILINDVFKLEMNCKEEN